MQLYNETHLFCIIMASKNKTEKQPKKDRLYGVTAVLEELQRLDDEKIEIESLIESESSKSHGRVWRGHRLIGMRFQFQICSGDGIPLWARKYMTKLAIPIQFPT